MTEEDQIQDWYLDHLQETSEWRERLNDERREDAERFND